MIVIDDIVVFPFKSLLTVFREIYNAAIQELEQEGERIRLELSQLYMSLETGGIDEAAFDERERELLDRLDELDAQQAESEDDTEDTSGAEEQEQEDDEGRGRRRRSLRVSPQFRTGNLSGGAVLQELPTCEPRKPPAATMDIQQLASRWNRLKRRGAIR